MLQHLLHLFPDAPVYTSVFDPSRVPAEVRRWDVRPTALQRFPAVHRYSRALLPLMPWAFERLDLSEFDVVVSVSTAFSKNVVVRPGAKNVCYCNTPPRYLWDLWDEYRQRVPASTLFSPLVGWLRNRDLEAARRVHHFVANSDNIAERVVRTYGRQSTVVYPPVDTDRIVPNEKPAEDFYLVVARLVPYKRVDLAVEACTRLGRRLIVVGRGGERARLEEQAGPTIQFAGELPDNEVADLYARCKAFIFPGLEDFGITAVEAQAAGRPVLAYGRGGAAETVVDRVTGLLFHDQTVSALIEAIEQLDSTPIDPQACRRNARRFDGAVFRERMSAVITAAIDG